MSDKRPGSFAYDAGTAAATVNVPDGAVVKQVFVLAGASAATVTIGGGDTITIPASTAFEVVVDGALPSADVVIGGTVSSYFVGWVA